MTSLVAVLFCYSMNRSLQRPNKYCYARNPYCTSFTSRPLWRPRPEPKIVVPPRLLSCREATHTQLRHKLSHGPVHLPGCAVLCCALTRETGGTPAVCTQSSDSIGRPLGQLRPMAVPCRLRPSPGTVLWPRLSQSRDTLLSWTVL